ncbi:crossover junction endodeoxyribonuclease RusA [Rhodococcus sp. AG1013]|uniref:hypothetical protein n=1 Tax=Rhodococcus sp. AG1013 TaxID=2183996 RepID=UPI000E0C4587|nr:hypothetical protein [Rhodococcus sp. AG1013]RDI32413.1 crossover junction endodeoxyribonuclease RusA [Rhodococcus sp. AG1013]
MNYMIVLPWTAPPLSMNDRGVSAGAAFAKAKKIRTIRDEVVCLAAAADLPRTVGHATVTLHYRPRDDRRRDTDNLTATAKPIYDGLVDYGLVADDVPQHMAKLEPVIHRKGQPALWLEISLSPDPKELPE